MFVCNEPASLSNKSIFLNESMWILTHIVQEILQYMRFCAPSTPPPPHPHTSNEAGLARSVLWRLFTINYKIYINENLYNIQYKKSK